jgi:hypothetical protein
MWKWLKWELDKTGKILSTHRKTLDFLEEMVGRNTDIKDDSNEVSEGNKEHVTWCWRKDDLSYRVKKLGDLCCNNGWKVQPVNNEHGHLARETAEIFEQNVENTA